MKSRFLAQHFTVNISKFQLPRKGVKSQLSISFSMSMDRLRPVRKDSGQVRIGVRGVDVGFVVSLWVQKQLFV